MLGPEKAKDLIESALAQSKADQTEVVLSSVDSGLTRFANNRIHQNVAESNATIRVRVVLGNRTGVSEGNDLSPEGIRRIVETARVIAQMQAGNPDFKGLPPPETARRVEAYSSRTADFSPEARAKQVEIMCRIARAGNLTAAGAFKTDSHELAVANSLGTFAYHPNTVVDVHTVMMSDSGSGYSASASTDVRDIDAEALAREAADKAVRSRNPIALRPGEYTVLLEEDAMSDVLDHLGRESFHALAVQEDRSFIKGHFGEQVLSETVTLGDDGLAEDTIALPFDYEGVPRKRVTFVERGLAREVTYDSATAMKEGKKSTGHSLPAPNTIGPIPLHMFMAPGSSTISDMIRGVAHGVVVTRFWYTRVVHPLRVVITGMTRDGTFLIENGQVTLPIKNMRFTTSYVDALNSVQKVANTTKLVREDWSSRCFRVPAVLLDGFSFTGVTQ